MQLSVIIVNYNVKYFLEHCLVSVMRASKNITAEIFVVDNASNDSSVEMVRAHFPDVQCIASKENLGFAKANNVALSKATGKYILYLNPDTLVPEDCFTKCIAYLEIHPQVGALGPHLIDGTGQFLPESKRGFPNFTTAFFKISGLSKLFSKSPFFNKYHMGYLPENKTNEVDVLAGCFMLMPKKVCDIVGGYSEDYFMYGEDIDLSYCVQKAGFKNIYFADTSVIHFKGESTKKGSLNYVKMFYSAMIIFAKKHLAPGKQKLFIPLIQCAISLRAVLSVLNKFLSALWLPIIDILLMLLSLWQIKNYWATYVKQSANYNLQSVTIFFSTYILTWLIGIYLNGGYDKPLKITSIIRGMAIATLVTLAIYGLLPEEVRFSRGITLLGAITATLSITLYRWLLQKLGVASLQSANDKSKGILLVGHTADFGAIKKVLNQAGVANDIIGEVHSNTDTATASASLGSIDALQSIAQLHHCNEIIFAQNNLSFSEIINIIKKNGPSLNYKMHSVGMQSIIGSNSKNTAGDLYAADWHFNIASAAGMRNKRLFDVLASVFIIITFYLYFKKHQNILSKALAVLSNKYTWFGYIHAQDAIQLPKLKKSHFPIASNITTAGAQQLNKKYARDYALEMDVQNLRNLLFSKKN
jgi:O-antigen biosynthesis protein